MKLIKNLKIRDKLLLLLFILLIPLLVFTAMKIRNEVEQNTELKETSVRLSESERLSAFIHEFQKERANILAASEEDSVFMMEAKFQRTLTDAAEKRLVDFFEQEKRSFSGIAMIGELEKYRNDLDRGQLDPVNFRHYSYDLIFTFLNRIDENAFGISNIEIRIKLLSFVNFVEAKVQLGRIRSLLMRVIEKGRFSYEDYALFGVQKNFYERALQDFQRHAPEQSKKDFKKLSATENFKETELLLHNLEVKPGFNLASMNSMAVYKEFTQSIEDFRQEEDALISAIQVEVKDQSNRKEAGLLMLVTIVLVTLGLATFLSYYIINLISNSLSSLKRAADHVTIGSTDVEIPVYSKDEIGDLADSLRGVVDKNKYLSAVTRAIGEGRYDMEVQVKSDQDILSNSIREMKDNLQRLSGESERRNHILSGISDLNNLMTGENVLERLSEKIISFLCSYSGSEAGVIFLNNESNLLVPVSAIGTRLGLKDIPSFEIGTGKTGQAVKDGEMMLLQDVPEEYLMIGTGLSEIRPADIVILPLIFSGNVIGAVELSSRKKYAGGDLEFFRSAAERIAIVIHTLKSHVHTQELLYETQNQAEELATQQEELRQLNAELKASEEELRVNQEELQEKNTELEEKAQLLEEQYEAVRTKNKALDDARQAIELKINQVEAVSKYKSEFLANMSHELRTPLNSILILSRLLADNREKNLNAKQTEHASIIHRSGADLLKLINEILDLSKIESGQMKLETGDVDVRELKVEEGFTEVAASKRINFRVRYAPDVYSPIVTDRFRLEQILRNFLGNAFKFTEQGGTVELTVYNFRDKERIKSETLRAQKEIVAFAVKDSGVGIAEDKQELIFEAFQQADASTTRKHGGTGLGLTISKELASLLGGEIFLDSEPGVGSTFTLLLPRVHSKDKRTATIKAGPVPAAPSKSKTEIGTVLDEVGASKDKKEVEVLIVEDDKGFNRILADFAVAKNFRVHQAFTGHEGLELAKKVKPDAILLDINLPDISGWDVLKEVRQDKDLRHVNVHVMSAYDREVTGNFESNEDYLPKPVTLEMLDKAFTNISAATDRSIERILIVEDNEVENKAVAELLDTHTIQSFSAYSAEEAEKILARNKVDCIILDLNLPGMKGYEWMERIRREKAHADIPIIIYSGKDLSEEEEVRLKRFANTIIIKNEYSYIRLLDEVQLFLHKVNQKLPSGKDFKMKLHVPEEILKDKKVLVVDDDVRNIYSLYSLLEMHGMNIVTAGDGKEALEKLDAEEGVDIVLMDIMMPEMDGIEAIKRLRKNYKFKDLPVIALTAKAMKGDKEKCIEAGASDYIPKPVDTEKLLTLMRVWLYER